ncbi:malonic semialdehyde reductase [Hydrogenophaga sp. BPS33]|uniref:malonic semialdehyde reductase n=1 Tax=Hydrogenophaga sp. BPS33 TaxID=2651974 RepID=UPI00132043A0|nr:malonic semialdehyde reductase [Hydrogenophaga sp. BPS33]QHE86549.1 malonic semialdehyde reductase [Hydrogenophaga sp. BPS33]
MIDDVAQDALFRHARSHNGWLDREVSTEQIHALYELLKWGPTSVNCSPARFLFLRTPLARERLRPHLAAGNVEKAMSAPVVVVVGYDLAFYEKVPQLFPHRPQAGAAFEGPQNQAHAEQTAFRNGSLQGAYLMLAARALGLDCGPMSGFDAAGVDATFWPGTQVKTNFLCGLGHGDPQRLFARLPRLTFDEACAIQ